MASMWLWVRIASQRLLLKLGPTPTAAVASVYLTVRYRERCVVRHENGLWVHEFSDGVIVKTEIGGTTARRLDRETRNEALFRYSPTTGDVIVDVGAGIGEAALTFSRLVGETGRVICLEAHPITFSCLSELIRRNDLRNVVAVQVAVSDADGELMISDLGETSLSNTVMAGERGIPVRAVTLDTLAVEHHLTRVDLLKANIEGAERLMIQGMHMLAPNVRNVAISCHDFVAERTGDDSFRTLSDVSAYLVDNGFQLTHRVDDLPELCDTLYGRRP